MVSLQKSLLAISSELDNLLHLSRYEVVLSGVNASITIGPRPFDPRIEFDSESVNANICARRT